MHRSNNAVIMQTEQLGRIEALEEELLSSKGKVAELEQKMMEQDRVIAQLVGDNLDHLQANMRLTAHINSSTERVERMEHRLGQVASVVMGFLEGTMEGLEEETSGSSGQSGFVFRGDKRVSTAGRCCWHGDLPFDGRCPIYGEIELWIWFWESTDRYF